MSLRPACTFLIPVFNGGPFMEKMVRNLISLADEDDEILIVDDGSNDYTKTMWFNLKKIDSRIKIVHQEHQGIVAALNNGISNSLNDFIARVDVDDTYRSDRIDLQIKAISEVDGSGLIFCDYEFVNQETQELLGAISSPVTPNLSLLALVNPQRMPHPGALLIKCALLDAGGYSAEDWPCEDYGLWLRIAQQYKIISVPETLLYYSVSQKSLTATHSVEMKIKVDELRAKYLPSILSRVSDYAILEEYFQYELMSDVSERNLLVRLYKRYRIFKFTTYMRVSFDLIKHWIETINAYNRIKRKRNRRNYARLTTEVVSHDLKLAD